MIPLDVAVLHPSAQKEHQTNKEKTLVPDCVFGPTPSNRGSSFVAGRKCFPVEWSRDEIPFVF
jgi:hypothetical protein